MNLADNDMTISRQLAYQRQHLAKGLCKYCSRPQYKAKMCTVHYEAHLARKRKR